MRSHRHMGLMLASALAASLTAVVPEGRQIRTGGAGPYSPQPIRTRDGPRLTKAQKKALKRARRNSQGKKGEAK